MNKLQSELEREQKSRLSAQTELRDQFLECRAHHTVSSQPKPTPTEVPDFLKKVNMGFDVIWHREYFHRQYMTHCELRLRVYLY